MSLLVHGLGLALSPAIGVRTDPKVQVVTVVGLPPPAVDRVPAPRQPPPARKVTKAPPPVARAPLLAMTSPPPEPSPLPPVAAAPSVPREVPSEAARPAVAGPSRVSATTGTGSAEVVAAALPPAADSGGLPTPVPFFKLTATPRLVSRAVPVFPPSMRSLGRSATVKVDALIDEQGAVRKVTVVGSAGKEFDQAAIVALMASRFAPGQVNDKPVAVVFRTQVDFKLQ